MNSEKMNNTIFDYFLVFLCAACTRIYIAFISYPVYTLSDEVSAMSVAAKLAGYDWSDVVSNAGYYGIGYMFIYGILFKLGISMILIYRIMILGSAVLLGLTAVVCYKIILDFFPMVSRGNRCFISSACGCLSIMNTYQPSMRNEEVILLAAWMISYELLGILDGKKTTKHEIRLLLISVYSLTFHTRAITFFLCLIIIEVIYFVIKRQLLIRIWFWFAYGAGYIFVACLLKLYKATVWTGNVRNSSVSTRVLENIQYLEFNLNTKNLSL